MNDLIQVIKVLDEDQLETFNNYVDTLEFDISRLPKIDGSPGVDTSNRSGLQLYLDEGVDVGADLLHSGLNNALSKYREKITEVHPNFKYYPVGGHLMRESLQVLEYHKGNQYRFHHDAAIDARLNEYYRQISAIVYLKIAEEGGGTTFPHKTFKPKAGYGLFFPANWCYPHSGTEVTKGVKRVAVTWYYMQSP